MRKGRRHLEPRAHRRHAGRHPHHARGHRRGRPDPGLPIRWSRSMPKPWRACAKGARTWRSTATARRRPPSCATPTGRTREDACAAEIARAVGIDGMGTFDADAAATTLMGDSHLRQPDDPGLRLAEGLDPAGARVADARHRAQRRGDREQQDGLRMGPPGSASARTELQKRVRPGQVIEFKKRETVEAIVARRVEFLTGYQNAAYADAVQAVRGQGAAGRVGHSARARR